MNKVSKSGGSPSLVTDGMYVARDLALDSTTLYWGEGRFYFQGRIAKAPISGGKPATVLSGIGKGTSAGPSSIAIADTGIVLAGNDGLKWVPIDGGPKIETLYWKLGLGVHYGAVTDNVYVYFFAGNATGHYDLLKLPLEEEIQTPCFQILHGYLGHLPSEAGWFSGSSRRSRPTQIL